MRTDDGLSGILVVPFLLAVSSLLSCTPATESEPGDTQAASLTRKEAASEGGPPPLVVDKGSPLLLDEPAEGQETPVAATTEAAAGNAACFVCHANYRTEWLVSRHAEADVGCVKCHGESAAHQNDENNTTAPEIMYSADKIGPFCRGCHKAPQKDDAGRKEGELDKPDPGRTVCTNCHGDHRMKVRTVIWDKQSGKLLQTNRAD